MKNLIIYLLTITLYSSIIYAQKTKKYTPDAHWKDPISNNDLSGLEYLKKKGKLDINKRDKSDKSILYYVKDLKILDFLLKNGVNTLHYKKFYPLEQFLRIPETYKLTNEELFNFTKKYIKNGTKIKSNKNILTYALSRNMEFFEFLVKNGAVPSYKLISRNTLLYNKQFKFKDFICIINLLKLNIDQYKYLLGETIKAGKPMFFNYLFQEKEFEKLKKKITKKDYIIFLTYSKDNKYDKSSKWYKSNSFKYNEDIYRELLKNIKLSKSDLLNLLLNNIKSENAFNTLLNNNKLDISELKNKEGVPLLHLIAKQKELLDLLLKKGAYINIKDNEGRNILSSILEAYPCTRNYSLKNQKNKIEIISYLLKKGAYLNTTDKKGNTPFIYALKSGEIDVINFLTLKKINSNYTNNKKVENVVLSNLCGFYCQNGDGEWPIDPSKIYIKKVLEFLDSLIKNKKFDNYCGIYKYIKESLASVNRNMSIQVINSLDKPSRDILNNIYENCHKK